MIVYLNGLCFTVKLALQGGTAQKAWYASSMELNLKWYYYTREHLYFIMVTIILWKYFRTIKVVHSYLM